MKANRQARELLCRVGQRIYQKGFVAANDGNLSIRLDSDTILITPTNCSKGAMDPDDQVVMDLEGNIRGEGHPSSEYRLHLEVYRQRTDVSAVVHAHPPYATAFALTGKGIEDFTLPEVVVVLGKVPLVPYRTPSTSGFATLAGEYARRYDALLLENHGALGLGGDLWAAYYTLERVEHVCQILAIAQNIGSVRILNREEIETLLKTYPVSPHIREIITE